MYIVYACQLKQNKMIKIDCDKQHFGKSKRWDFLVVCQLSLAWNPSVTGRFIILSISPAQSFDYWKIYFFEEIPFILFDTKLTTLNFQRV